MVALPPLLLSTKLIVELLPLVVSVAVPAELLPKNWVNPRGGTFVNGERCKQAFLVALLRLGMIVKTTSPLCWRTILAVHANGITRQIKGRNFFSTRLCSPSPTRPFWS